MGWGSVLAGIAGGVGGFFLGGPAGAVALGSQAYQAASSAGAEKKAANQQQAAYGRIADIYQPFYNVGGQATNAIAQGFGLEGANFGALPPGVMMGSGQVPVGPQPSAWNTFAQKAQASKIPQASAPMPPMVVDPSSSGRLSDLAAKASRKRSSSSYAEQKES